MMQNAVSEQFLQKVKKYTLIAIGSISWSITMVKSGWHYTSLGANGPGIGFWGANGHDGIWHIALAESLSRGSLNAPTYAGSYLQNYHLGFDLLLALLHKITTIPVINLYFQILPPLFAVLIGFLSYGFVLKWTKSGGNAFWSTFFVYFGGSLGWVLASGESAFWSQQAISTLINPPFALSLIFLLLGLKMILKLEQKFNLLGFVLTVLIFGSLIEIKSYAGILGLGALVVTGIYSYIFYKKSLYLKIFLCSLVLSLILFLPLNYGGVSLLIFKPFWFLESMMGFADRVNYPKFYSAMINYRAGDNYLKATVFYSIAFLIFWVGNMGTRVLGSIWFAKWFKNFKKIESVEVFMAVIIFTGCLIPMLFVQSGTPWNTIQFFYYSVFFSSIFAGLVVSKIKNLWTLLIIVLLTIPTTVMTLKDVYIPGRPPAMVKSDELNALDFLSLQPAGVVLSKPFNSSESSNAEANPPRSLYLYTSTAYVSALSDHQTFFEDEINLDITGYDWQKRRDMVSDWFMQKNIDNDNKFLRSNNISYIYWLKQGQSPLDLSRLKVSNIYENDLVTIYKVD